MESLRSFLKLIRRWHSLFFIKLSAYTLFFTKNEIWHVYFLRKLPKVWQRYIQMPKGGSKLAATSKMERFMIIVNGFQPLNIIAKHFQPLTIIRKPLTIITKRSILDVAAALDPPLMSSYFVDYLLLSIWFNR